MITLRMNGSVDSSDFGILAANYGKTGSNIGWTDGDFNYDGTVNLLDFNLLADNYGQTQLPADLPDGPGKAEISSDRSSRGGALNRSWSLAPLRVSSVGVPAATVTP